MLGGMAARNTRQEYSSGGSSAVGRQGGVHFVAGTARRLVLTRHCQLGRSADDEHRGEHRAEACRFNCERAAVDSQVVAE